MTVNEAQGHGLEVLDEVCQFLDSKELKDDKIYYLRKRCRALSFPILYHKFDDLVKLKQKDNYIDEWCILKDISLRAQNLKSDFKKTLAC